MFESEELDASLFDKAQEIYLGNFQSVLDLILYCYGLIIQNEQPKHFSKGFRLENHFTNILVEYLKDNKDKYGLENLGFEIEVGNVKLDRKTVKFIDIKVTNASHYFLGKYVEDIYYAIECKRLTTYSDKINAYIKEGILRFINLDYSKGLPLAGMIGYIEDGDPEEIVRKINNKLRLKFAQIETLKELDKHNINDKFKFSYHSRHLKDDVIGEIDIYHLMLEYSCLILS